MQENIQPHFDMTAIENTLLTRDYLAARKKAENLQDAARNEARKLINQAWYESDDIKARAYQEGFESGLICCIADIVSHFRAIGQEYERLCRELEQQLIALMEDVFRDNTIFIHLVSDWFKKNSGGHHGDVVVFLPEGQSLLASQLCARLRPHLLTEPKISYHQQSYYQVKMGDQLMEFNTEAFTAGAVQRLIYNNEKIHEKINAITAESQQKLYEIFHPRTGLGG